MSTRTRSVGIIVSLVVLVAAVLTGVYLIRQDGEVAATPVEYEYDPDAVAKDVALDDPNREAYFLRDIHSWWEEEYKVPLDMTDEELLEVGEVACLSLEAGLSLEETAFLFEEAGMPIWMTLGFVAASPVWLCPEHVNN